MVRLPIALITILLTIYPSTNAGAVPPAKPAAGSTHQLINNQTFKHKSTGLYISANSQYMQTSGTQKSCREHTDCYSMREPDEWCLSPSADQFLDKGCFCDPGRSMCSIERTGPSGYQYTDCTSNAQSKCYGSGGIQLQDVGSNYQQNQARSMAVSGGVSLTQNSIYARSSGQSKYCRQHEDCYGMREPSEWCPMPNYDKYYEKGCFCDQFMGKCVIERSTPSGSEYTDCASKSSFQCNSGYQQYPQVSQQSAAVVKSPQYSTNDLTVSTNGRYVSSTGRQKTCTQHSDCYGMREPSEWCPLPTYDRYYEKGCFCDRGRNYCTIERQVSDGGTEYTDCTDISTFQCRTG